MVSATPTIINPHSERKGETEYGEDGSDRK